MSQPFMPLFFGDFLASTPTWDGEERGLYLLLLAYQWSAGPLPSDTKRLAKMTGYDHDKFQCLWLNVVRLKFEETAAGLVNARLEDHRLKSLAISKKRAEVGKVGAAKRWQADSNSHDVAIGKTMPSIPNQTIPNQSIQNESVKSKTKTPVDDRLDRVFSHWQSVHNHSDSRLSDARKKIIRSALKDYSEDQLCESISGYKLSPFHQGHNDRGQVYDSIELMLKDAKRIDAGIGFARNPPRVKSAADLRVEATAQAMRDFVEGRYD